MKWYNDLYNAVVGASTIRIPRSNLIHHLKKIDCAYDSLMTRLVRIETKKSPDTDKISVSIWFTKIGGVVSHFLYFSDTESYLSYHYDGSTSIQVKDIHTQAGMDEALERIRATVILLENFH